MPTVMPPDITMSKNKYKMNAEMSISPHEKKEKRVDFSIIVEEKMVDDKAKLVFKCAHYSTSIGGDSRAEYTSLSKFKKVVNDKLDYLAKELG